MLPRKRYGFNKIVIRVRYHFAINNMNLTTNDNNKARKLVVVGKRTRNIREYLFKNVHII